MNLLSHKKSLSSCSPAQPRLQHGQRSGEPLPCIQHSSLWDRHAFCWTSKGGNFLQPSHYSPVLNH